MSGGSNFVHDIVGWVEAKKDTAKVEREELYEYYAMMAERDNDDDTELRNTVRALVEKAFPEDTVKKIIEEALTKLSEDGLPTS